MRMDCMELTDSKAGCIWSAESTPWDIQGENSVIGRSTCTSEYAAEVVGCALERSSVEWPGGSRRETLEAPRAHAANFRGLVLGWIEAKFYK